MPSTDEHAPQADPLSCGATAVITHQVRDGHAPDYERWLIEIVAVVRDKPGFLDSQVIRPVPGVTRTFVVVLRFQDHDYLEAWLDSDDRRALIDRVRPILEAEDRFHIRSGLDFWFVPEGTNARVPVRWKQALITWSAIYPLVYAAPPAVLPLLRAVHIPAHPVTDTAITTGLLVLLMVYAIMPHYTRLVQRWLFR